MSYTTCEHLWRVATQPITLADYGMCGRSDGPYANHSTIEFRYCEHCRKIEHLAFGHPRKWEDVTEWVDTRHLGRLLAYDPWETEHLSKYPSDKSIVEVGGR